MEKLKFVAYVRGQKTFILTGKITSKKLAPFINKKVEITVKLLNGVKNGN